MIYPKISLVTTCYNHRQYIAETIESILSQGYPNLEYIVIDDGSTDGSWEVIEQYRDRLTYCERMDGYRDTPTIALNYGFSKTSGELMGWLNSDDILLPKSLFTIAKIFTDVTEAQWITGMASTINQTSELVNARLRIVHEYDYLIGDWQVIQQESTFWRKTLWDKAGGYLEGREKWAFDTELWTRFFALAPHYHVGVPLGAFRKGTQSKSVSQADSFLTPNAIYLQAMRQRAPIVKRLVAQVYFLFKRSLRWFLALLPHAVLSRLPLLGRFMVPFVTYSFVDNKWVVKQVNGFRSSL